MTWVSLGLPGGVLVSTLAVVGLAFMLRRTSHPCSAEWCASYVRLVGTYRTVFSMLLLLLWGVATLFLLLGLVYGGDRHEVALLGGVDSLCCLAYYGLWRWTWWLMNVAINRVNDSVEPIQ